MAVPWNQTRIFAPSTRRPASSVIRPCTKASGRSAVSRRKTSRRNSCSVGSRQLGTVRQGTAHSGVSREQKSTQSPGSLGSQSDGGMASGSTSGGVGPRPSHQMHPSGRSTQRTSRASMTDVDVLGAAERPRERRQDGERRHRQQQAERDPLRDSSFRHPALRVDR